MPKQNNENGGPRDNYEAAQAEVAHAVDAKAGIDAQYKEALDLHGALRAEVPEGQEYPFADEEESLARAMKEELDPVLKKITIAEQMLARLYLKSWNSAIEEDEARDRKHNRKKALANISAVQEELGHIAESMDVRYGGLRGEIRDVMGIARDLKLQLEEDASRNESNEDHLASLLAEGYNRIKMKMLQIGMHESLKMKE